MQRLILLILALLAPVPTFSADAPVQAQRPAPFTLGTGDRVVFLGDTFIEREQLESYIETMLTLRFPDQNVIFRNIGWSADTPLGESRAGFDAPEKGFDRLKEHLAAVKPTVVFLSHGMSQSFNGPEGLPRFEADMRTLVNSIKEIAGSNVRLVFLGPIAHEKLPPPLPDPAPHNEQLKAYSNALKKLAVEQNAHFIDLFAGISMPVDGNPTPPLTDNGIHLNPAGYWRVASLVETRLGLGRQIRVGVSPDGQIRQGSFGLAVSNVQRQGDGFTFDAAATAHVLPPCPSAEWRGKLLTSGLRLGVQGLASGEFALRIDGVPVLVKSSTDWPMGPYIFTGPLFDQAEEIRLVIQKKNELYFHRWRPENETYLFGFRKHEQGQNAREIPMFDPLIADLEARIAELKKLRTFKFELAAATPDDRARAGRPKNEAPKQAERPATAVTQPLPTFDMGPGLEVNLFAENPLLAKPIQMNFDPQGRLWVASSSVYPQIQPGQEADDKILVLEDSDNDGKADKTTVFADGLLIPTGVAQGDGGVYVANSTQLVFFKDTDGDGKADSRRIVLSGFGTEDTHHILHTLRWGHDGQLYMNQSIYIHSHIETPHGVVRLNSGGIWNFRPETMELGVHMKGLVNSWGHHFDRFGQSFATDGAGGEGINWVIPQAMYFTYAGARRILPSVSPGSYPKFCGLEVVESRHFPEDWQGTIVTCDFRAHRVVRFAINDSESAYITKELPDVMRTTNVTFRPIDAKVGPDGALYIADWSNPIIQHGEVDFRDPRRDHEHGRIWRVTAKGRPLLPRPEASKKSIAETFDALLSPDNYVRQQARRVLTERRKSIQGELARWTAAQSTDQGLLEALWIHQSIDLANGALLEKVLASGDGRIRAAGVRTLSFWRDRLPNRDALLARLVLDEHPRVRMEAMRALAKIPTAKSAELVLAATEKPMDKYLDYAAWLSINDLAEPWLEAVKSGAWSPGGKEKQLAFGLGALTPALAASVLPVVLPSGLLPASGEGPWIDLISKSGSPKDLARLLDQSIQGQFEPTAMGRALSGLAEAARLRNARPDGDLNRVESLLDSPNENTKAAATRLVGSWKIASLSPRLLSAASTSNSPTSVRAAAFQSLREIGGETVNKGLAKIAAESADPGVRSQAVLTLAAIDLKQAAPLAIEVLQGAAGESEAVALWRQLLSLKGAAPVLAQALPKSGFPAIAVKSGLRVAREGGRNEPNLVLALARNLESEETDKSLTPAELNSLIENIAKNGDAARGEVVYRRPELACVTCHAIGGVGGKVGPDMTSIGASAPIDYLVESIQFPNRKIKEGYHSTLVETRDGEELSGLLVRETAEQLILRDAGNREVAIAKNNISRRGTTGSLMPAGLVDALSPGEQADLYRFLSELGKSGKYDASKSDVARHFKVLAATIDLAQFGDDRVVRRPLSDPAWGAAFTLVDGSLLKADVQRQVNRTGSRSVPSAYVATQFTVAKDGPISLQIENAAPSALFIDGKPSSSTPELKAGLHTLILKLDAAKLPESLRVRSTDATFSTQ